MFTNNSSTERKQDYSLQKAQIIKLVNMNHYMRQRTENSEFCQCLKNNAMRDIFGHFLDMHR